MDRVDDVFARLKYLLKAQGSIFIAVPNEIRTHYMESHGSLIDMPPNHIGRWTREAFDAVCRRHGLQLSLCEREPFNVSKFLREDIVDSFLRRAEKPGSVSEFGARPAAKQSAADWASCDRTCAFTITLAGMGLRGQERLDAGECALGEDRQGRVRGSARSIGSARRRSAPWA